MLARPLRSTAKPLLLAPFGALVVVAVPLVFFDDDRDFGWSIPTVIVLGYALLLCYVLELCLVVPVLVLRPSVRAPHPLVATAVGIAVAWCLPLARVAFDGDGFWESVAPAPLAGAASGCLYGVLMLRGNGTNQNGS